MSDSDLYSLLRQKYDRYLLRGDWTPSRHKRVVDALERAEKREKERARYKRRLKRQLLESLALEDGQ